jgi:Tfp pilus assembly protein FimT
MTMVELVIVLALIGVMMAFAASTVGNWSKDQRAASSARSIADAFALARGEAIRTGRNHIVAFDVETGLAGISSDIVIVNDGPTCAGSGCSNCRIDSGEIVHSVTLERDVVFGSDADLANGAAAPNDSGGSGNQLAGSSFQDAHTASLGDASWVMFGSDGLPRRFTQNASTAAPCTELGIVGQAGGAIYVTNGSRDYAVVLSPLGTVRLHRWEKGAGAWTQ